ncbi:MAG: DUF1287 domain-containing protein [Fulvivirga sp.]|nr:DUF1287 domain-containing protein [Fulvivirga sp.]
MKHNYLLPFILSLFLSLAGFGQSSFYQSLADSAKTLSNTAVTYYPGYFSIDYPNGDIPANKGVCTDVIIRAYRKIGIDLQVEVHRDMKANFDAYPKLWGLKTTDKNIDHRRVPNLMTFFERHGEVRSGSNDPADYAPGDIVCWDLGKGITHIGILIDEKSRDGKRNLVIHNIGSGQVIEDILFDFKIIGHFRYKK